MRDSDRRPIRMQVTRAERDRDLWSDLNHDARSDLPCVPAEELTRRIWSAIQRKHEDLLTLNDGVVINELVLVLNAIRTPWFALTSVVSTFRRLYGQEARDIGFEAVWIVGPTDAFTHRLDT